MSTRTAKRSSASKPCPVCESGTKGCSSNEDGSFFCRGEPVQPSLWVCVKKGEEFNTYRRVGDRHKANGKPSSPPPDPAADWNALTRRFAAKLTPARRAALAANLDLPAEAIDGLRDIGFNPDDSYGPCWTLPERDARGSVIGINRRWPKAVNISQQWKNKAAVKGSNRGLYLGSGWDAGTGPILIPEGASDVLALALCGLSAVGRPSAGAGASLLAAALRSVSRDRSLIVLGENDERDGKWPGRAGATSIAAKLTTELRRPVQWALPPAHFKDAREWVHALGQQVRQLPGGADDWPVVGREILAHLSEVVRAVEPEREPEPVELSPLPVTYFADIAARLETADFVEEFLIDGAMSVIYGESNTGKTFFVLDLALHVAAGLPWNGREVERRGVLYLALEGSRGISNRVAAFKAAHLVTNADLPFAIVPVALDLLNPAADTQKVIKAATAAAAKLGIPVGLIVVDTLSRAIAGGNENSSEDMGALVRNLDLIRQALPAHISIIHHSGKDGAKGARGHSLLRAATDTEIEVTHDAGTRTSIAKVTKQRDLELGDAFAFKLESVNLGINRRGKAVTSCVVREADVPNRDGGLPGDQQTALVIITDLIREQGLVGEFGPSAGVKSVPESWWRDRYYAAKRDASPEAKKKSFARAVKALIAAGRVGMDGTKGRVWLTGDTSEQKLGRAG